ncbi:hypothetical protein D3C86_1535260 [compost metagenome]
MGICGHSQSRPGAVLRSRRLHARHVAEAVQRDQPAAGLRKACSRFHAMERRTRRTDGTMLHQQGLFPLASVSKSDGGPRARHRASRDDRRRTRHAGFPQTHLRCLRVDHHAGTRSARASRHGRCATGDKWLQRPDGPRLADDRRD